MLDQEMYLEGLSESARERVLLMDSAYLAEFHRRAWMLMILTLTASVGAFVHFQFGGDPLESVSMPLIASAIGGLILWGVRRSHEKARTRIMLERNYGNSRPGA